MTAPQINYTVIIPHYNIPELLGRCLRTIPQRPDIQVIVVDDCSTDENFTKAKEICGKYKSVTLYQTDICGGGGKARNVGLQHARGKYLIFADADDYFNLCFPEVLEKYKDTTFDIIYFGANSVDTVTYLDATRAWWHKDMIEEYVRSGEALKIKYKFPVPWAKFISRRLVTENDIRFEETRIANDVTFSGHVDFYAKKIYAELIAIYCVTDRAESTEKQKSMDKILTRMQVDAGLVKFIHQNEGIPPTFINSLKSDYVYIVEKGDSEALVAARKILLDSGLSYQFLEKEIHKNKIRAKLGRIKRAIISLFFKLGN